MQTGWLRYKCWQGQGYFHAVSQAAHILFLPPTYQQSQLKSMEGIFFLQLDFTSVVQEGVETQSFASASYCCNCLQEYEADQWQFELVRQ